MSGNASSKSGLLLITALGMAVVAFVLLIAQDLFFQGPTVGPSMKEEVLSSATVPSLKDQPDKDGPSDPAGGRPPIQVSVRVETKQPESVPDEDRMTAQLNMEGLARYNRGDYSEAAVLFQKAYERNSRNLTLRTNLALAQGGLAWKQVGAHQYQDALLNFQSAIRLKPDEPTFFVGQGLAYYRMNETDSAVHHLKAALALDPNIPEAYKILGDIYYQRDEIEMANGYYEKGLELDPSDASLRRHLDKVRREQTAQAGFQQKASRAFTIKFEGREEQDAAQLILRDLDEAYREIGRAVSYYPQQSITVILYSSQQFRDVTRTPSWTKGLFDGKIRVPIGGAEQDPRLLKKVLFHEYTHAVVFEITRGLPVPTWLNEGVALHLEDLSDSGAMKPTGREEDLHRRLRAGQTMVPLSGLHGGFMGLSDDQAALAYDESASAFKALADRYGLYRIVRLLEALGERKEFAEAFSDQFMIPYETFESDWSETVRRAIR